MKKKKFTATAVALAMAAVTVFSVGNTQSVKAADVTDNAPIDLKIDGNYQEKQISKADSDVINKAFGYDSGTNSVLVCGENSKGYIDWDKSSIPHWKVYQTEVFTPVLSRDTEGNLVVKTDSNGKLATKENGLYGKQTVYAGYDDPSTFVYQISWGDNHFSPSQGGNKSDDGKYYYADNEINLNMGLKTYEFAAYDGFTYLGKQTQNIEDVYIVRVCYTADDKMNYTYTSSLQDRGEGGYDINGNYVDFSSDDAWAEYNKDRTLRYIDFWILPEGVSTVLNFEDETPDENKNGLQQSADGNWYYYTNNNIDYNYNGLAANEYGWWKITNGTVDFSYTGMAANEYGWWYVSNGTIDFGYTGMAVNEYGWWYITNGALDFNYTGMAVNEYGWWYMTNGALDFNYTGMAVNEYGWWYMTNGALDFNYTGMAVNEYGWWYMTNGALDFNYTGMAVNEYGWWYMTNGALDFNYTGMALNEYGWWYMTNGALDLNYTGLAVNEYGWWYMTNGTVDFTYNGLAENEYGVWNVVNGHVEV